MILWHYRLDEDEELRLCDSAELESLFVNAESAAIELASITRMTEYGENQLQHWLERARRCQIELKARADGDILTYRIKGKHEEYMQCHATIWNKYVATRSIKFRCIRRGVVRISCRLYTIALCKQHTHIHKRAGTIRVDGKYLPHVREV